MFCKLFVMIFLLSSCQEAKPKVREIYFRSQTGHKCKTITHNNTLKDCSDGVKEIINATNIVVYDD